MLRRSRWLVVTLVLLALAVRIAFLAADSHPYADSGLAADSAEIARQIDQHGRWFESNLVALNQLGVLQNRRQRLIDPASLDFREADAHPWLQPEALQPPGEAVVLAAVWKLTGSERWLGYLLLMVVLGALMTPLVVYISFELFARRRAAYLAGLLYAVYPPLAWLATIPHLDSWAVDLTIVTTALLLRARRSDRQVRWLLAAGVMVGLGCYFRPELLLLAPLVALASLSWQRRRDALRMGTLPTVVAIAILTPWTIRNAEVFHRFIPVRIGTGQALWEGLGEIHNNFGAVLNDAVTNRQVNAVQPDLVYGSPAYDSFLEAKALSAISTHPAFYATLIGTRLLRSTLLLNNGDWAEDLTGFVRRLAAGLEPLLFLISVVVLVLTWRRFARSHLILIAVLTATIGPYLLLHFEPRYALPAAFAYLVWTALGVDMLAERIAAGSVRSIAHVRNLRDPRHLLELRRR